MPTLLIGILVYACVLAILLWGLARVPWFDADVKQFIRVVLIVVFALWVLFALLGSVPMFPAFSYRR
jgi:hypothetical protein